MKHPHNPGTKPLTWTNAISRFLMLHDKEVRKEIIDYLIWIGVIVMLFVAYFALGV